MAGWTLRIVGAQITERDTSAVPVSHIVYVPTKRHQRGPLLSREPQTHRDPLAEDVGAVMISSFARQTKVTHARLPQLCLLDLCGHKFYNVHMLDESPNLLEPVETEEWQNQHPDADLERVQWEAKPLHVRDVPVIVQRDLKSSAAKHGVTMGKMVELLVLFYEANTRQFEQQLANHEID